MLLKRPFLFLHFLFPPEAFCFSGYVVVFVSHFSSERPSNLIIKKSSQYTTICFVSTIIRFSMNICLCPLSRMVGSSGLEPPTSCLSGTRSNHLSYEPMVLFGCLFHFPSPFATGGDDGIRTHDPLLAGQVLSQLSYTPIGAFLIILFCGFADSFLSPLTVSAPTYLPVPSPVKYFRHYTA